MVKNDIDVVVAGSICLDLTPEFKKLKETSMQEIFIPGKNKAMNRMHISTGGPVSNTGIGLIKLGIATELVCKIGDDLFGEGVIKQLSKYSTSQKLKCLKGEETSYTVVIVPEGFDRIFLHAAGANDTFGYDDIDYDMVSRAKIFHLGYPTTMKKMYSNNGEELIRIYKKVKSLGTTTSLDMSLPDQNAENGKMDWDAVLKELLPYVDIFLPSAEETMFMIDRAEYDKLAGNAGTSDILENLDINILSVLGKRLLSYGAKIVALKSGVKGFYLATADADKIAHMGNARPLDVNNWANRELHEESFQVPVAAATGSGDSSIAGLLSAFLKGLAIEDAIKFACCVGGQNVQVLDAVSGIRSYEETLRLMHEWQKNRLDIQGGHFKYIPEKQVFAGKGDQLNG